MLETNDCVTLRHLAFSDVLYAYTLLFFALNVTCFTLKPCQKDITDKQFRQMSPRVVILKCMDGQIFLHLFLPFY